MFSLERLWHELNNFHMESHSWVVLGDFNVIQFDAERTRGSPSSLMAISYFNDCLDFCGLVEMCFQGHSMSWCNGQEG